MSELILKEGKEKKIKNNYLWIFRDEVGNWDDVRDNSQCIVNVKSWGGEFLGRAFFNPRSHIAARILTRGNERIDRNFFRDRILEAVNRRKRLKIRSNAMRLVHAEGDNLPGLIVDRFGDYLVIQSRIPGVESFKHEIMLALTDLIQVAGIYERSDMEMRGEEGLAPVRGEICGSVPRYVEIVENGFRFIVDIHYGQKTGFYLDQRDNRGIVRNMVRRGDRVLDLFCYTGGFSIYSAGGGAYVIGIDSDNSATDIARENAKLNKLNERTRFFTSDAFDAVKSMSDEGEKFDLIIIDPPAMAKTKKGAESARWGIYKLALASLRMLEAGGRLVISSCAYHISLDMLQEMIRFAANDVGKRLRVINITFQPEDHPWILQMPETLYLKTIYLEVLN
jgi:23S rRNA (cytosine1962-C5)-methyltransferase